VTFVRSSLERILWPYLIWSLIFYTLMYAATAATEPLTRYIKDLVVGYPYHFVPLLVFWYVATPALVWIGRRRGALLLLAIVAWQAWLLVVRFPEMFGLTGKLPQWAATTLPPVLATTMSEWGVYFPIGLVLSLHSAALKPALERWRLVSIVAVAVLFGLGLLNAFGFVDAPWARLAAPLPLMFVLPTIDRTSIPWLDAFERLGRRSYGIYLVHFVVVSGLAVVAGKYFLPLGAQPFLVFPAFLIAALGVSLFLMDVMARFIVGRRVYRYMFGIVPPPLRQS
jgi:peptidoglycan/LPS O-acetylase OafA/YrhL